MAIVSDPYRIQHVQQDGAGIARSEGSSVLDGRFDDELNRFVTVEEVLEHHIPPVFRHLSSRSQRSDCRSDISSSKGQVL
ncbi:hypothetical protein BBJ28_00005434 [Nothophytophthora sp. Chile5]|nr:hypothetical protein BBJ28_00005434 [Nothophytophthora sp. Chile5]